MGSIDTIEELLRGLTLPSCLYGVAALPLPRLASPSPVPPSSSQLASATGAAAAWTCASRLNNEAFLCELLVTNSLPPLPQATTAPSLGAPIRSADAARAAAGTGGDSSRPLASCGIDRIGVPLQGDALAWVSFAPTKLLRLAAAVRSCGTTEFSAATRPQLVLRIVLTAASFRGYAPWAFPDASRAAGEVLRAVCGNQANTARIDSQAIAAAGIPQLVSWIEHSMRGSGAWDEDGPLQHVRHLATWVVTNADDDAWTRTLAIENTESTSNAPRDLLARILPLTLRLTSSWQVTSVWLGAGCLWRAITAAPVSSLRVHGMLLSEAVARVAGARHAVTTSIASVLGPVLLRILHGSAPALPRPTASLSASASVAFNGPYDDALDATMRSLSLASNAEMQFAIVSAMPVLLVLMLSDRYVGCVSRHVGRLLRALDAATADTSDARLAIASLHVLRVLLIVARERFTRQPLSTPMNSSSRTQGPIQILVTAEGDAPAIADALERVVLSAAQAFVQAGEGLYFQPTENSIGIPVYAPGDSSAVASAMKAVTAHASSLLAEAEALQPCEVRRVLNWLQNEISGVHFPLVQLLPP